MYMASSLQGSMEALRSVNAVAHFTHYTVGHAHLGAYGFVSMVLFGAIYFMMPRVLNWEWPFPKLITVHFWLSAIGIAIYFTSLTIGGWLQGLAMLDPARAFMESVTLTLPYLQWRSSGGGLLLLRTWFRRPLHGHGAAFRPDAHRRRAVRCPPTPGPAYGNEIKLAAGAMVALGVATAALVVLPYVQARATSRRRPSSSPTPTRSCVAARSMSPTAASIATASSRATARWPPISSAAGAAPRFRRLRLRQLAAGQDAPAPTCSTSVPASRARTGTWATCTSRAPT